MAGSAVIGALRVDLSIDSAEFRAGLDKARGALASAGKSMTSIGKTMSLAISAPLAALGTGIVKTAGDFEASMNRVGAASGASASEMKAMQDLAMKLGADTSKSATEAADAMEMLAKNGVAPTDILNGAADAAVKLSIATGGQLSSAADVATNAMAQFSKKAEDLGKVSDQITGVTLQSQFGFEDYALALGQAGGVAGALGVKFEDFNAAIAATSSVFNSGSDAGTSFKTFLTSLVPKSKQASEAMAELKLSFFNADGSMKSMSAVAEELKTKMSGLSQQDLSEKMNTIFGVDGMRTAIALMQQGGKGIEDMTAKINSASADQQAEARMKGFNGQLEQLSGAIETLGLKIAQSGLLQFMTDLVAKLGAIVDWLGQTNPEILKWGTIVGGLAVVIGPAVAALGLMVTGMAALSAPVLAAVAAIAAVAVGITVLYQGMQLALPFIEQLAGDVWQRIVSGVQSASQAFVSFKDSVVQLGSDIIAAFAALPAKMMEIGGQIIDGLWQGIQAKWESVKAGVSSIGTSISDGFRSVLGIHSPSVVMHEIGENIMQGLQNGMDGLKGGVVSTATEAASGVSNAFSSLKDLGQTLGSSVGDLFSGFIKGGDAAKDAVANLAKQLASFALNDGLKALTNAFGGGSSSGGAGGGFNLGSVFGSIAKSLFGFAQGGSIMPGGGGGIDSQVVAFRKSPTEQVDIYDPRRASKGGGGTSIHQGNIIIQGDASERTVSLIDAKLKENNRQLAYAQQNSWRS
jgi:TP901 family phage tail tape measure protein